MRVIINGKMQKYQHILIYLILALATIILGLLSRSDLVPLPDFIAAYAGDTLWALLVFWLLCLFFPGRPTRHLVIAALAFAFAIEFSQFYQAPWIENLRGNTLGGLILGFGFKFSDLICYSAGIFSGALIKLYLLDKFARPAARSNGE